MKNHDFTCKKCQKDFSVPWDFGAEVTCPFCDTVWETDWDYANADDDLLGPWLSKELIMRTTVDVYEDVPKKPFLVRCYTLDVPNSQTSRVGIQRGTDFVCVREDYGKAVSEAKRESRRDRKSRWVTIEQVLLETSIIVSTKEGEPPATISEFVDAVDALVLPPITDGDWDGVVELAKQLHGRLGDDRLNALLEVLQAANDPDTRSPK